jgi:FAD/FMN-containing dehydrogenase
VTEWRGNRKGASFVSRPDFGDFPSIFQGSTFRPGDPGYTQARTIWNCRTMDAGPAFIAQCADTEDVVTAVRYASDHDLSFALRSGGHSTDGSGMPDGAFVVDLSRLKAIEVHPASGIVRVEPGVTLGELDAATQKHGLVVPAGTVTTTGVAGLALGGGLGFNTRRFGMTVDNTVAYDMVSVDGRRVRTSADENPDLFWGLRGAGHNLGVVTSFEFQAHRIGPDVHSGLILYPLDQAEEILTGLDAHMAGASRALTVDPVLLPAPPLPGLPESLIGAPILILVVVHTGDPATADEAVKAVSALGTPMANTVGPSTWLQANSILDVIAPPGRRNYSKGGYIAALTPPVAAAFIDQMGRAPAPDGPGVSAAIAFQAVSGAVHDFDEDSVAFSRTGAMWLWEAVVQWDDPARDDQFLAFTAEALASVKPHVLSNSYVNLTAHQGEEWLRGLYGSPRKFRRLQALKAEWDPRNLLRFNKNIEPASDIGPIR